MAKLFLTTLAAGALAVAFTSAACAGGVSPKRAYTCDDMTILTQDWHGIVWGTSEEIVVINEDDGTFTSPDGKKVRQPDDGFGHIMVVKRAIKCDARWMFVWRKLPR